jgi:centrosomal protein CEP290
MEREQQITLLNEKLAQATEEIESNIRVIENFQSKINLSEDTEKTERMVRSLQSKVQRLEEKLERKSKQLESVEHEAEMKSKELTSLLSRMHAYESGQYGLPEAVAEIKDLKLQIKIRDKQIESVTQEINLLHMQVSDLQDENEMFRDNLGLDTQADVRRDTKRYTRNRKNELTALRSKVSQLEEEVVTLKSRNYSLKKQVNEIDSLTTQQQHIPSQQQQHFVPERERDRPDGGSVSSPKPGSDSTQSNINHADIFRGMTGLGVRVEEWKEKYEIILEENAALRRGLHEILDCMQKMTGRTNPSPPIFYLI